MQTLPVTSNDATALSDRAWEIIDPEGLHEADERAWAQELARQFAAGGPCETFGELRGRLEGVGERAAAEMSSVPPTAIAVLMAFLAEHPERHELGEALLSDALRTSSLRGGAAEEVISWLSERREVPEAAHRHHQLPEELRHIGPRPSRRDDN